MVPGRSPRPSIRTLIENSSPSRTFGGASTSSRLRFFSGRRSPTSSEWTGIPAAAAERARSREGPTLIEASVERLLPHTSDDDDTVYRSREELQEARKRVLAALEKVGLADKVKHYPQMLSGGEQQRVGIARAIVTKPPLLLADEPTGNLDSANGSEVMQLLTGLNEAGTTIVMVTHDPAQADYAHRTINLFDGRIVTENMHTEVQAPAQD